MKRIVFNINDDQEKLLQKLMEKKYLFNVSEAMRFLLVDCAERYLNNYKEVAKMKILNRPSPKDKELEKMEAEDERKRLKEERFYDERRDICNALGGTEQDQNGFPVCVFNKYIELPGTRGMESTPTTIPFEALSEEQIQLQYQDMVGRTGLDVKEALLDKYKK